MPGWPASPLTGARPSFEPTMLLRFSMSMLLAPPVKVALVVSVNENDRLPGVAAEPAQVPVLVTLFSV